jgi:hypothetical protein
VSVSKRQMENIETKQAELKKGLEMIHNGMGGVDFGDE